MALRGTLDTFALPDVLRLLGATSKSGRLRITGDRGTGSVWVHDGAITLVDATHAPHATEPGDALFELLRFHDGSFTFDAGAAADEPGPSIDVEALLSQSEELLEEWRDIECVVPSMDLWVTLQPNLPRADVTVDQDRWSTIVAVGAGATVRRIGDELCLGELPVSRAIVRLVEAGLVSVSEVAPAGSPRLVADPIADSYRSLPPLEGIDDVTVEERPLVAPVLDPAVDELAVPLQVVAEPDEVAAPVRPGPRARRARSAAAPAVAEETGLFVPLELPGRAGPASYDAPPKVAEPSAPVPAPSIAVPESSDSPEGSDELAASFPGLANRADAVPTAIEDEEIAKHLASLSPKAAQAILAAVAPELAGGEGDVDDGERQPMSRGLLLKFLSSVKS